MTFLYGRKTSWNRRWYTKLNLLFFPIFLLFPKYDKSMISSFKFLIFFEKNVLRYIKYDEVRFFFDFSIFIINIL